MFLVNRHLLANETGIRGILATCSGNLVLLIGDPFVVPVWERWKMNEEAFTLWSIKLAMENHPFLQLMRPGCHGFSGDQSVKILELMSFLVADLDTLKH